MIDKEFWIKVAGEWKKADDGIETPPIDPNVFEGIGEDVVSDDSDIDDILSEFDI